MQLANATGQLTAAQLIVLHEEHACPEPAALGEAAMLYFFPYADDERETSFTPWVTYGLIALCALVFLVQLLLPQRLEMGGALFPGQLFGYDYRSSVLPAWGTLFTHVFLHVGVLHLAGNMLYLWIFGDNVEQQLGHGAYLIVFLCLGAAAGWTHAFAYPLQGGLIGASGAISGLLGIYLICRPHSRVHFIIGFLGWYRTFKIAAWIVISIWVVFQGFSLSGQMLSEDDNVAYLAHLAGFVAALPLGLVLRLRQMRRVSTSAQPTE